MKKLEILASAVKSAAVLAVAAIGFMPFTSCDKYDDSGLQQQIDDINDRLTVLEENMDAQLNALQAIIDGKTTILSCLLDETTGMYTITLTDEDNTVIQIPAVGNDIVPVITFIEEDGVKYWATVSEDGTKTAITDASGDRIEIGGSVPALKLGENGEWMVSADGTTWTGLGITSENAAIFAKAEETDDSVIFTLADGTVLEVNKYDDSQAAFYPLAGKQYFDAGETKVVEFALEGIVNIGVMEVPAGWYARTSKSSLTVTAPAADASGAELDGVVKILGVTSDGKSFISEVYVEVGEPALEISISADKTFSIDVIANLGYDNSVFYGIMPTSDYSPETIVAGLADYSISYEMTSESLSDVPLSQLLGSEPEDGVSYTIWAVVSSWEGYSASDIYSASYQPISVSIDITDIGFDTMSIEVNVSGATSFVPGFFIKSDDGLTLEQILEDYKAYGSEFTVTGGSYSGLLVNYGAYGDVPVSAGADYVIYALPLIDGKASEAYTVEDFFYEEVSTPSLQAGGSVNVTLSEVDATMSSVSAAIEAEGAYKVYGAYMAKEDYDALADDAAIVSSLAASFPLFTPYTVSQSNLTPGTDGYIVAVAIDKDGKYGAVARAEANTKALTWSDAVTLSLGEVTAGLTSVSIPYTVEGGEITTLKYINMTEAEFNNMAYLGWTRDLSVMEEYLATVDYDQYGGIQYGVTTIPDYYGSTSLPEDNTIRIDWLQTGRLYLFYLVAVDADGNIVHGVECTYTPGLPGTQIMREDNPDYEVGKPEVTFKQAICSNPSFPAEAFYTFTMDITAPAECKEYFICPMEQMADWTNAFYYVLSNGGSYSGSQTDFTMEFVVPTGLIGLVWVDNNDMYHQTYIYQCMDVIESLNGPISGGNTGGGGADTGDSAR